MDNNYIGNLKERLNIADIIGEYVDINRSGGSLKACCPFHKEKTPSFVVNEEKQFFKCFGCGKSGDVFTFIEEIENVEFMDAVKILASKIGYELPSNGSYQKNNHKEIKQINLDAGRYYYRSLLKDARALNYLKERRLLPETIKSFGLGYANNTPELLESLLSKYSEDLIVESGIATKNNQNLRLVFRDRIIFPIFNVRDELIGFGGRLLGQFGPKYINSRETPIYSKKEHLYALNIAKKNIVNEAIILVEGYMDVISMHQNGYKNTVATLGTALTIEQANLLSKHARTVFLLYDSDEAGVKATLKALEIFLNIGLESRVITLQGAKDPDEFFLQKDKQDFDQMIADSLNYLMYNIVYIGEKYDLSTNMGLDYFAKDATDFIKNYMKHNYARQTYVEDAVIYISKVTGFSIKSIGTDIFGQYFSPKQFTKVADTDISAPHSNLIALENEDKEIDKKEELILNGIILGKVSIDEINIEDFNLNKNKIIYYQIKINNEISLEGDYSKVLTDDEYKLLIKNIKNIKLEKRIKFLENVQANYLKSDSNQDMEIALIVGNYIIKLKKLKG